MPRAPLLSLLLLAAFTVPVAQTAPPAAPARPTALQAQLDQLLAAGAPGPSGRALPVHSGMVVLDAASGAALYRRQAETPITPASNMKLLSMTAALYRLGPDYWFSTGVTRSNPGAAVNHLTLSGIGDPSLRVSDGEHSLAGLARQVRARGILQVGNVQVDGHMIAPDGWPLPDAETAVSALPLDEGEDARPDPTPTAALLRAGALFRRELQRAGVQVTGGVRLGRAGAEQGVATTRSLPLTALVRLTLKRSDNRWAEQLYARSGVDEHTPSWRPSTLAQARTLQAAILARLGVNTAALQIHDASGLSEQDRLTAAAVSQLLLGIYRHPLGTELAPEAAFRQRANLLIESLPQAGTGTATEQATLEGGTLAARLPGLDVRAKTGTLVGASSLSGYVTTRSGRVLIFSILMDQYAGYGQSLRQLQDRIVTLLYTRG
ncbi:D-alanyl-D-alanine carboxypeptidase/D-alanyl-D-alanine-endopeptidase [Deinococcus sonorensis]|uniref:D-alanyl-D-alanine carboxypeptidase n=2 Tax=Deinococcus sonorensis TaxID=309891 RepID=A0AAU7UEK0_9DEIO